MTLKEITENEYEEFKKNPKAILILTKRDCPPCEVYSEEIKAVAQGNKDILFATVYFNHLGLQNMKMEWKAFNPNEFVRVPQTFVYKDGKVVAQKEGVLERDELLAVVNKYFGKSFVKSSK